MDLGYKEPFAILYLILHQKSNECETCGNGTAFQNMKQGFKRFCSRRCRANSPEQIEMTRERLHNDKVRSKILATSKAKYGTPYAITSKQARAKSAKTCLKRYGVENGGAAPEARAKRAKTMIDRYGVEDVALQYLHHELKVPADKIITTHKEGIPTIPWTDNEGKDRRYHPDIYIYICQSARSLVAHRSQVLLHGRAAFDKNRAVQRASSQNQSMCRGRLSNQGAHS